MKNSLLQEISIHAFTEFKLGSAEYPDSNSGCTVILSESGYPTGIDIRVVLLHLEKVDYLNPLAANDGVHAIVLSGGSAFGLDTASGVMKFLAERNIGFPTAAGVVPIVCASCLFDLMVIQHKNIRTLILVIKHAKMHIKESLKKEDTEPVLVLLSGRYMVQNKPPLLP